ncbi:hypothetical protein H4R34_001001 [Dimargaris verticillata]|uniref:Rab-GAP TBC domain-containing protein n=1 Tax=Dimargaris verticillata TaxID=2761393 RepID=A0A9W8B712_9FUNG|nr:hypothetical protein H4R34_001001 [Dimargaris verticillata]
MDNTTLFGRWFGPRPAAPTPDLHASSFPTEEPSAPPAAQRWGLPSSLRNPITQGGLFNFTRTAFGAIPAATTHPPHHPNAFASSQSSPTSPTHPVPIRSGQAKPRAVNIIDLASDNPFHVESNVYSSSTATVGALTRQPAGPNAQVLGRQRSSSFLDGCMSSLNQVTAPGPTVQPLAQKDAPALGHQLPTPTSMRNHSQETPAQSRRVDPAPVAFSLPTYARGPGSHDSHLAKAALANDAATYGHSRCSGAAEPRYGEIDDDDDDDDEEDDDDEVIERDRYGFSKYNQYQSREEYSLFEREYEPVLEHRKVKWRQLFVDAHGQWPSRSAKLKRYIRKGIPAEIRGPCWFHYSGAARKYRDNPNKYRKLVQVYLRQGRQSEFADIIERDLHRTFPDNEHFQMRFKTVHSNHKGRQSILYDAKALKAPLALPDPLKPMENDQHIEAKQKSCVESLRRILNVFTLYCPQVGYNQSLSYIVGLLLLFLTEEQTFWMLVTIVEDHMPPGYFNLSQEYCLVDQEVLLSLLETKMPAVHRHLCAETFGNSANNSGASAAGGPEILPGVFLAMSHWFPLLFVDVLPIESVLRVWDCFFYEGSKVLFRVALALFKLNEMVLLQTKDSLEQFQLVQEFPRKMIHCHHLMQVCFGRALSLSRTDIDELRRQHYNRRKRRSMMMKLHKQQSRTPRTKGFANWRKS